MNKTTKIIFGAAALTLVIFGVKVIHTYTVIRQKFTEALKIKFEKVKITGYTHPELKTEIKIYIENRTEWQFYITDVKLNLIQADKKLGSISQKFSKNILVPANGSASVDINPVFMLNEIYAQGPSLINQPLKISGHIGIKKGKFGYFNLPVDHTLPSLAQAGIQMLNNII